MVAIHTRYSGPTNTRGSRIIAHRMDWSPSHRTRVMVSYDDSLSSDAAHFAGVKKLCAKFNWHGKLVCGGSDTGLVWVWAPNSLSVRQDEYPQVWEV